MVSISTLGQQQTQTALLRSMQMQLATLQTQVATQKKAQLLKGLGTDAITTKRARADTQKLDSYLQNIDRANSRISQMTLGIQSIQKQVNDVIDSVVNQTQKGNVELDFIRRLAENSYDFIVDALNLKDGDAYVFTGSDAGTKPFIESGTIDAYYGNLNAEWVAGTLTITPPNTTIAQEYISRYKNIPESILGYSGSLTDAKQVYVRADDTAELNYTVLANNQAFKDIVAAVNALKNIGNLDTAPGATEEERRNNFFAVFNDIAATLTKAVDNLDTERFKLGTVQVQLERIKEDHIYEKNVLANTIGKIEDVDMNEVALKVTRLTTQLEASYQVTSLVSRLTLVNFLR
jgi:flagellar hook-associated protein 3 FlgL